MEFNNILDNKEYEILKTHPKMGDNLILLAYGGSIAYGTNVPTSDVDVRGIALNPLNEVVGVEKDFEQIQFSETDTVVYSLNKVIKLLFSCNPNVIEILGCKDDHYLYLSDYGRLLLTNKNNFLSKRAIDTFGGYASAQYNRLEHGLLGNGENEDKKLEMLKHSLKREITAFNAHHQDLNKNLFLRLERLSTDDLLSIYPEKEIEDENSDEHLVLSGTLDSIPLGDFRALLAQLTTIKNDYGSINKRNTKKTDIKLAKHMMHLIRLYLMGTDLNTSMTIKTYRDTDHKMLMDIRNGKYMTRDGMHVKSAFYDLLKDIQDKYEYSVRNTILPDKPNYDAITEMLSDILRSRLK